MDERRLQEDSDKLRHMEAAYLRAKALVGSQAYDDASLEALDRIQAIVDMAASKACERAPMTVGAIVEVLYQLKRPVITIRDYEALKKSLDTRRSVAP